MENERKPIFFTSDWHIGHANVLKFSNRPFRDVGHMAEVLINNYNASVPKHGICYFLGDIGLCSSATLKEVIDRLKGTKILIIGNHDKKTQAMYKLGFEVVMYGASLRIAKKRVTLAHYPLLGVPREDTEGMRGGAIRENWHGESQEKRRIFTCTDEGQYHLHGHIHSPNGGKSTRILHRQFDVGVDANKYLPVSISRIESWILKTDAKEALGFGK